MFKTILFDVGVHQRIQRNDITPLLMALSDKDINRGGIAEAFVGTELVKQSAPHLLPALYYWHREAKSSNAEVDYVIQKGAEIIPIEVKSGTKGQMQSLHLFLSERDLALGIRVSTENFTEYDKIMTIPLYAVNRIFSTDVNSSDRIFDSQTNQEQCRLEM
jgi:predicted AAA+ superfamily ATPase